jgi:hypothetical protein
MKAMYHAMKESRRSHDADSAERDDADEKDMEPPLEKYLKKVRARVHRKAFVDPMTLSRSYLDYVKEKNPARGQQRLITLGNSVRMATDEPLLKDVSRDYDEHRFRQGMDYLLLMYAEDETVSSRVPDMLKFSQKLWSMRVGTATQRLKFAKEFMYKHAKSLDWATLMDTDIVLMRESFDDGDACDNQRGRSRSRSPRRGGKGAQRSNSRRGRSPQGRGRAKSKPGAKPTCYSRTDPAVGQCTYNSCRFSHECASCGQDHPASSCPKWDKRKEKKRP